MIPWRRCHGFITQNLTLVRPSGISIFNGEVKGWSYNREEWCGQQSSRSATASPRSNPPRAYTSKQPIASGSRQVLLFLCSLV